MADELDVLLERVTDASLRAQLRAEIDKVRAKRTFGLVFESHLPERVTLPDHPVRRGASVVRRGQRAGKSEPMRVTSVRRGEATVDGPDSTETLPVDDLVVVAEFGVPIHPGLTRLGGVRRGGDKPAHVVINAENHHALEMLQFTHAGKVDCIYIDPPYNTGARDWKYDNDYVDAEDAYRHSKWLAFMERRLLLAKKLLNPENSVLIVTIDEKEYLRLGMLLQQTFPASTIQMVSININPAAVSRPGGFGRADEYAFFVMCGEASPQRVRLSRDWVSAQGRTHTGAIRWDLLRRSGPNASRADRPGLFYPIYIDGHGVIRQVGDPLRPGESAPEVDGCVALLPIRRDGSEGNWQAMPATLRKRIEQGRVRVTGSVTKGYTISVLKEGEFQKIAAGEYRVTGRRADGSVEVEATGGAGSGVLAVGSSQWRLASHDATQYGSRLLQMFLPNRRFPFPKSLYAVEDAIRFFVADKPDAAVLDFFSGSGTTAHAVMRLNRQDGGRRRSISVTNNEVSADEAKQLNEQGFRDGDPEWEALGIFEHITRPRVTAAVTGSTPDGAPIKGDYKFTDEFPMAEGFEENVEFVKLSYLDPLDVELDRAFSAIAPLLWMRAGQQGALIEARVDEHGDPLPFAAAERYGVLFDPDRWQEFVAALPGSATTVFVVTDSAAVFAAVAEQLPPGLDVTRLYENYLTTFAINRGGAT